jgi:putative glycosyltransferase (TIGR04348 family)
MKRSPAIAQSVVIVTPAQADNNNGNWRTAWRWQRFLAPRYPTRLVKAWPDEHAGDDTAMIALHARRSADSLAAWHARHGSGRLALVMTGTDLYRDIETDPAAQRSLAMARYLVVLQELGALHLPECHREKARTIFQSAPARKPLAKPATRLRALAVGHLREEKSPETIFEAARMLKDRPDIFLDHIGNPLDPVLARQAEETMVECPNYRWLDGRPHEETRRRIQRAHLLIHPSRMEGGAHVVLEAVVSGTPVLASHIDGNIGMLGAGYAGYFPWSNATALAALLAVCRDDPTYLERLRRQSAERAHSFASATECAAVRRLAADLFAG